MSEVMCWNCSSKNIREFEDLICGDFTVIGKKVEAFLCKDCGVVWNETTKKVMQTRISDVAIKAERIRQAFALYRRGRK